MRSTDNIDLYNYSPRFNFCLEILAMYYIRVRSSVMIFQPYKLHLPRNAKPYITELRNTKAKQQKTTRNTPDYALHRSRSRIPFRSLIVLHTVLDNPGVSRYFVKRDSLLGVKHEQLHGISGWTRWH